jgi:hypothetical protein
MIPSYAPHKGESPMADAFWEHVQKRSLSLPYCASCDSSRWYLQEGCSCGSNAISWKEMKGTGSVFTYTVVHRTFLPNRSPEGPYVVGLIELDGAPGVRIPGTIVAKEPRVGLRVSLHWEDLGTHILPVFK